MVKFSMAVTLKGGKGALAGKKNTGGLVDD